MQTFGERILWCIERIGTSQAKLAREAKVTPASISDWARNISRPDNIKAEPLVRAARFLQVDPLWLLTGIGGAEAYMPSAKVQRLIAAEATPQKPPFSAELLRAIDGLAADMQRRLENSLRVQLDLPLLPAQPSNGKRRPA